MCEVCLLLDIEPTELLNFDYKNLGFNQLKSNQSYEQLSFERDKERKLYEGIIEKQTQEIQFLRSLLQGK